eukprot:6144985-Prymnesium_polylepis.2
MRRRLDVRHTERVHVCVRQPDLRELQRLQQAAPLLVEPLCVQEHIIGARVAARSLHTGTLRLFLRHLLGLLVRLRPRQEGAQVRLCPAGRVCGGRDTSHRISVDGSPVSVRAAPPKHLSAPCSPTSLQGRACVASRTRWNCRLSSLCGGRARARRLDHTRCSPRIRIRTNEKRKSSRRSSRSSVRKGLRWLPAVPWPRRPLATPADGQIATPQSEDLPAAGASAVTLAEGMAAGASAVTPVEGMAAGSVLAESTARPVDTAFARWRPGKRWAG